MSAQYQNGALVQEIRGDRVLWAVRAIQEGMSCAAIRAYGAHGDYETGGTVSEMTP